MSAIEMQRVDGNAITPIDNTAPRIGLQVTHHQVRLTDLRWQLLA